MGHPCAAGGKGACRGQQQKRQKRQSKPTISVIEFIAAAALMCWLPGGATSASTCPLLDWNYCARVVFLNAGMTCDLVQIYYGITPERFQMLNPLLNCSSLPDNCMGCIENMAPTPGPWQEETPSPSPPSPPRPPRSPKVYTPSPPPPPPPTLQIPSPAPPPPPPFTRVFRYLPPRPPSPPPRPPVPSSPPFPPAALPAPPPPLRHPYPPRPPPRAPPFTPFPPLNPIVNPPQLPKSPPPPPRSPPPPYQYLSPPPFWWSSPPPPAGGGGGAFKISPPPPQIINPWISPPPVPSQPPPPPVVLSPDDPSLPTSPYYVNRVDVLTRHNMYRAKHQIISLSWSDNLAAAAQVWANNCWFEHSQYAYGENVAVSMPNIDAAIDAWYREIKLYNYASPGFSETTGHFTQLVWASTMRVGCAIGYCPNGVQVASSTWNGKLFVCEYDPPGNAWGSFTTNVYPSSYQRKKEL